MFEYDIVTLSFSGEETVEFEKGSLFILIGPNNCGKSHALRDISGHLNLASQPESKFRQVVTDVKTKVHNGTPGGLSDWLGGYYRTNIAAEPLRFSVAQSQGHRTINRNQLPHLGENAKAPSKLAPFLVHELDTASRLNLANSCNSIAVYTDPPLHYIHTIQADEEKLKRISTEVRKAFGVDLVINWGRGNHVGIHLGDAPSISVGDRVSREYVEAVNRLPMIEEEGDGIRSFVGCLLGVMYGAHKILLIDEPEAFLHPPQAKRLGLLLAESAKSLGRQIIIATHSSSVVLGAMSSSAKVAVCRLDRRGDKNHAHILSSEELDELWSEPLLRSSNAVEGIFHHGVVVCESDRDCRFYEAVLRRLEENDEFNLPVDFHFVHGGGKGQLATLALLYRRLHVPVAVIADFDILSDQTEFEKLIEAFGGKLVNVQGEYNSASSALANLPPTKSLEDCVSELRDLVNQIESKGVISNADRRQASDLLAGTKDWSEAKKYGINKLQGGANEACQRVPCVLT